MRTPQPRQGFILAAFAWVLGLSITWGVYLPTFRPFIAGIMALWHCYPTPHGPIERWHHFRSSAAVTVVPNIIALLTGALVGAML
jgi:hypothetical protein